MGNTEKKMLIRLCLLLLISIIGCSNSPRNDDPRTPIRVFLLLISNNQVEFYNWAEKTYELRHPEIDIQIEQFPGTSLKDYEVKLRLMYASDQAPDIWSFRENELAAYVEMGLLEPAPDSMCQFVKEQGINEMIRDAPFFGEHCYGITQHAGWQILYYNRDHFVETGLDPDKPPRDWKEFLDYARQLTITDDQGRIQRAGLSLRKTGYKQGTAEKWLTFFYSAGGTPFNSDGTASYFDSVAGKAAFEFYDKALNHLRIDAPYLDGDQRGFGQGTVSMFIREDHVIEWLAEYYPDVNYSTAPIPPRDTTLTSYSSGGAFPMVVSSTSTVKKEAWHFLSFLFEEEVYTRYAEVVQAQPLYYYVANKPSFNQNPDLVTYAQQPVFPPPKFAHDKYSLEVIGEYVERFSYGRLPLSTVSERMNDDINTLLRVAR